jgi:hypothetical protein
VSTTTVLRSAPATSAERAVTSAAALVEPIGLDELMELAELQTRVDRKYFVPADVFHRMIAELRGELRVRDIDGKRTFGYESPAPPRPMWTAGGRRSCAVSTSSTPSDC